MMVEVVVDVVLGVDEVAITLDVLVVVESSSSTRVESGVSFSPALTRGAPAAPHEATRTTKTIHENARDRVDTMRCPLIRCVTRAWRWSCGRCTSGQAQETLDSSTPKRSAAITAKTTVKPLSIAIGSATAPKPPLPMMTLRNPRMAQ